MQPDFRLENHGSVILFRPLNKRAREWLDSNCVTEDWQWFGGAMSCEPRCAPDILWSLRDEGFKVEG